LKKIVTQDALLNIANERLQNMPHFESGMRIFAVETHGTIFVLRSEFFFDVSGKPTEKTIRVLPVYDELAKALGIEFSVI
jgi:hypothetical protein